MNITKMIYYRNQTDNDVSLFYVKVCLSFAELHHMTPIKYGVAKSPSTPSTVSTKIELGCAL